MSNAVGSYLRGMPNAADEDQFNENTRRRLDGLGPVKPQLTAEEIKVAYEEAIAADQAYQDQVASIEAGKVFIAGHPEWRNTKENIALLNHELVSRFGVREYTIPHYEEAYASLRASNFLNLDKNALAAQEKQAAKEKFNAEKARSATSAARAFNPNVDYNALSLEEIRERANEEARQQMQRRGEEGGW